MVSKKGDPDKEDEITERRMFFSRDESADFKESYEKALDSNETSFMFKGERFNTVYARYIISYLKMNQY